MSDDRSALLQATRELAHKVDDLSHRLTAKEILHKRTLRLTVATFALAVLSSIGVGVSLYAVNGLNHVTTLNEKNAIIACKNANDSREANRILWLTILDASRNDPSPDEPRTAEDERISREFEVWINKLYAPRDCYNLSKRYPLPDPPNLIRND